MKSPAKFRIPRKQKKRHTFVFRGRLYLERLAWKENKQMVIARNYIKAGIPLKITPEIKNWIKNGLMTETYWNKKFNYWINP